MLPIERTEKRLEAIKKIAERHHITWDPEQGAESTMDEDTQLYFLDRDDEDRKVPARFAVLKEGGESGNFCVYADYETLADAKADACEHIEDDIFAETPVAIYDLDENTVLVPDWQKVPWVREENRTSRLYTSGQRSRGERATPAARRSR